LVQVLQSYDTLLTGMQQQFIVSDDDGIFDS